MFSRKGKEPGKGKGYSGVNLLEQQLSNLKNDVQLRDSQLHDFLKDMICDNPDLSRSLQGEHPSAETINSHFRQYENLIRHLTVNMIKILNGEKELSSSVKRLNSEIQDQKSNSNLILENSDRSTEGLKSLLHQISGTADVAREASVTAENGTLELNILLNHIQSINQNMNLTWQQMDELRKASSSISEFTAVINDTAERLHLISVNASIEASRMANKGFQVIAKEIQKMASGTSQTVTRVDTMVKDILSRVQSVDDALSSSQESTQVCLEKSDHVKQSFSEITAMNSRLNKETDDIRRELLNQEEGINEIAGFSKNISSSTLKIASEAEKATDLSETLLDIVNSVIEEIGQYRLSWHNQIRDEAQEGVKLFLSLLATEQESVDSALGKFLMRFPNYELVYIMNDNGQQMSSNIFRKSDNSIEFLPGFGEDRSSQEYFHIARNKNSHYLTNLYLSSATGELCITVSIPFVFHNEPHVLAADVNVRNLAGLSH